MENREIHKGDLEPCAFCNKDVDTHFDFHCGQICACCNSMVVCCLDCAEKISDWFAKAKPIIEYETLENKSEPLF